MRVLEHRLTFATTSPIAFLDITDAVRDWVRASGVGAGLLTVTSPHTTARITRNERDPALQADMARFLEALAPPEAAYAHNLDTVDGRANAHSHLLGLCMPASESIPVRGGDLALGSWQALFLVELDGPRPRREVWLQLLAAD